MHQRAEICGLGDRAPFGYHVVGNLGTYTAGIIRCVLNRCDFRSQFEYDWEQESLLSALFSVAAPLRRPYMWRTDTSNYPWKLSLVKLDPAGKPELVPAEFGGTAEG